ncbi:hypothetical protein HYX58_05340 [Candidatus Dependentiae bacterium]|nr:hypothetical protein [Candidatus Dependentiae bacterium]
MNKYKVIVLMLLATKSLTAGEMEMGNNVLRATFKDISEKIREQDFSQVKKILDNLQETSGISKKADLEKRGLTSFQYLTESLIGMVRRYQNNQARGIAEKIIYKLIVLGADIQYEDATVEGKKTGITLLDKALFFEEPRIFNALLTGARESLSPAAFNALMNKKNIYDGKTVMHFAVACHDSNGALLVPSICADVYMFLVKEGARQDIPDANGETAVALRERIIRERSQKTETGKMHYALMSLRVNLDALAARIK